MIDLMKNFRMLQCYKTSVTVVDITIKQILSVNIKQRSSVK